MSRFALLLALLVPLAACSSSSDPGFGTARPSLNLARTALASGAPELALSASRDVLAREPHNDAALEVQGDAYYQLSQPQLADASYRAALAVNPGAVEARIGLGRLALAGNPAVAEAEFLRALQRDPRNAVALNDLGIARDLQGRRTEAQQAYRQAIALAPAMHAAEVNLALSLAMSGQADAGMVILRPLLGSADASPRMRQDMAEVATLAHDDAAARALLGNGDGAPQVQ